MGHWTHLVTAVKVTKVILNIAVITTTTISPLTPCAVLAKKKCRMVRKLSGIDLGGVTPKKGGYLFYLYTYISVFSATCDDGIKNQEETEIDCGGPCTACPTCDDGIENQGETDIDCGGPCTACPTCDDGIQNQGETGVDCGVPCSPCPTCDDGIQNQGEADVDCGGPCTACPSCNDGIQNQGETFIDCGEPCTACKGTRTRPQ